MYEINFINLWFLFAGVVTLFILGLLISRHLDSARLFHSLSIGCAILALYMPIFLKFQSSWSFASIHVNNLAAAPGFLFALKFLELSFGLEWTYTQTITWKQLAINFSAFPETLNSGIEHSQDARRKSIFNILRAVIQFVVLRAILRFTPIEWVSQPLSLLSPVLWPFRYALLGIILYLVIAMAFNFVFGIGGFIWNVRMNSMFPAFPYFATSLRDFWSRRWNAYVKTLLHRISFIVIPKLIGTNKTMTKATSGFIAFAISAVFHEYLFMVSYGRWSGKNMIFFLLHGVLTRLEIASQSLVKTTYPMGKLLGWAWTMGILLVTSPLFFDPWIETNYLVNLKTNLG
jgi:hypothetical protein